MLINTSLIISRASFCGYAAWAFGITSTSLDKNDLIIVPSTNLVSTPSSSSLLPTATTTTTATDDTSYSYNDSIQCKNDSSISTLEELDKCNTNNRMIMLQTCSERVRNEIRSILQSDPTLAGSLLRLAFHDAATTEYIHKNKNNNIYYVGGPNGSVVYEMDWSENRGLTKPLTIVQQIYENEKKIHTTTSSTTTTTNNNNNSDNNDYLSLVDIIALAGATSVEFAGGPAIPIHLGRMDVMEPDARIRRHPLEQPKTKKQSSSVVVVETTLPSAGLDSDGLRLYFHSLGLTDEQFVALCGAHDLGRHVSLIGMSKQCLKNLTRDCLEHAPTLLPFVAAKDPDKFTNTYFQQLLLWNNRTIEMGSAYFIPTDVDLVVDKGLRRYTTRFANNQSYFFEVFKTAYQKIVDVGTTSTLRY